MISPMDHWSDSPKTREPAEHGPAPGSRPFHLRLRAAAGVAVCVALLEAGCATPWSQTAPASFPSTKATPTAAQGVGVELLPVKNEPAAKGPAGTPTGADQDSGESPAAQSPPAAAVPGSSQTGATEAVIRGQNPDLTPGSKDHFRQGMPISGPGMAATAPAAPDGNRSSSIYDPQVQPAQNASDPYYPPGATAGDPSYNPYPNGPSYPPPTGYPAGSGPSYGNGAPSYGAPPPAGGGYTTGPFAPYDGSAIPQPFTDVGPVPYGPNAGLGVGPYPGNYADLEIDLRETQTGRFMFGVGVNSDLGMTAQVIVDERNFNWRRYPRSLDDVVNGTAWRGGGQQLRIEAIPGSQVQRYMVNFTQPYLMNTPISFNLSAYLYDRRFFDWDEERLGGRVGLGYRLTPDVSLSGALRLENVDITNPRVLGVSELDRALGQSSLYSGRVSLTHDTRDLPFAPTQGHYLEFSFEQAFGTFDYPRGQVDFRRYFLISERPDRSGRHTLANSLRFGVTGSQTPIYENFFAGGYSTLRGFRFRHASPKDNDVIVGGEMSLLGSTEYLFPITADDMLKGVFFVDYGTIEENLHINWDDFRVAVGFGFRVNVPAMGPAPIAIDFAIPLAREDTDRIQNFSFFVGFGR